MSRLKELHSQDQEQVLVTGRMTPGKLLADSHILALI
jgi:hypothetical protein